MTEALARHLPDRADLVAMNLEEASAMAGVSADDRAPGAQARVAIERIAAAHPRLALSVTAGRNGSWVRDGASVQQPPAKGARLAAHKAPRRALHQGFSSSKSMAATRSVRASRSTPISASTE